MPPPPVILWQVVSQSFSCFKSTSSCQSVIFFTSQSHFFTRLTPGTMQHQCCFFETQCTVAEFFEKSTSPFSYTGVSPWSRLFTGVLVYRHVCLHLQVCLFTGVFIYRCVCLQVSWLVVWCHLSRKILMDQSRLKLRMLWERWERCFALLKILRINAVLNWGPWTIDLCKSIHACLCFSYI